MYALIVDDNPVNCNLLERVVGKIEDCTAVSFTDPLVALSKAADTPFAVALVDYMMPEINGVDFIKVLRQLPGCEGMPAILVTGSADKHVQETAMAAGAADFVTKPIDPIELRKLIRRHLKMP